MIREKTPNHRSCPEVPGFEELLGMDSADNFQKFHSDVEVEKDKR